MRTRLSICRRKRRFPSRQAALDAIVPDGTPLRPYRCDRCTHFHLTGRTKGKPLTSSHRDGRPPIG